MAAGGKTHKAGKRERREAAREAKREEMRRRQAQQRRRTMAIYGGVGLVVVAVAGLIAWSAARPKPPAPGVSFPSQGQTHSSPGQSHPAYNSNPPTSGWHNPGPAPWGTYRQEIPDEVLMHNLEHSGIWISYKAPTDAALIDKLETLASRYKRGDSWTGSKLIVTPRPKNDSKIAVAAWTHLLKLDEYDEQKIVDFINAYRNRGPERLPD